MGLFSVQRRPRYRQENAMGNANALTALLGMKAEQMNGISEAVDNYGQSQTRGELAELFKDEAYMKANPEQAMAQMFGITGGRNLGDSGKFMMDSSLDNKGDLQENQMKQDAASLLFSRQNSQIAQRHANALSQDKSNAKLLGLDNAGNGLTGEQYATAKSDISRFKEIINDKASNSEAKSTARKGMNALLFNINQKIAASKFDSSTKHQLSLFGQNNGGVAGLTGLNVNHLGHPGLGAKGNDFSPDTALSTMIKRGGLVKAPYEKGKPQAYTIIRPGKNDATVRKSLAVDYARDILLGK